MGKPYLLLGPERGKKEDKIQEIIKLTEKQLGEGAEVHKFYPFEDSVLTMIETALNGSLLTSNIVLIIDQADTIKVKEAAFFKEYFESPNPNATLIFKTEEISSTKVSAAITKAIAKSETIIFWEMFESDKRSWLHRFFLDAKIRISGDGLEYILEMLENNTAEFKATCQNIATFYPPGTELTAEKLEEFLYHSKEENPFTLFHKIAIGDFQGALDVYKKLSLEGNLVYPFLMGSLLSQFKKLFEWSSMAEENYSTEDIAAKLAIRSKKGKEEFMKAASLYSSSQIQSIILLTIKSDGQLREARSELQSTLVELYLYTVIVRKGEIENFEATFSQL